jgi:hypothetical protein
MYASTVDAFISARYISVKIDMKIIVHCRERVCGGRVKGQLFFDLNLRLFVLVLFSLFICPQSEQLVDGYSFHRRFISFTLDA